MVSICAKHAVLLRSDGKVATAGCNKYGQCQLPAAFERFKQVSAGSEHTILLRTDGEIEAFGRNDLGQCDLPKLQHLPCPDQLEYIQVSAGIVHSVALRSDGHVAYTGVNHGRIPQLAAADHLGGAANAGEPRPLIDGEYVDDEEQHNLDAQADGLDALRYVAVSAGGRHTALLRSDGLAVAVGRNEQGQCSLPGMDAPIAQVVAGGMHTVVLSNTGEVKAVGGNFSRQCDIPKRCQTPSASYVRLSASTDHSVLLRSDGQVEAYGSNAWGQCDIPPLDVGMVYMQASAGAWSTLLLRSDGQVVVAGWEWPSLRAIPSVSGYQSWSHYLWLQRVLPEGVAYAPDFSEIALRDSCSTDVTVQIVAKVNGAVCEIRCLSLGGRELAAFEAPSDAEIGAIQNIMSQNLDVEIWRLQAVLPSGSLMKKCRRNQRFVDVAFSTDAD